MCAALIAMTGARHYCLVLLGLNGSVARRSSVRLLSDWPEFDSQRSHQLPIDSSIGTGYNVVVSQERQQQKGFGKWVGFDLDGTLAFDGGGEHTGQIGAPIPATAEIVKALLAEGREVRIVTARVAPGFGDHEGQRAKVLAWFIEHFGIGVAIVHGKDPDMETLYDDRAVQLVKNTGERVGNIQR